MQKQITAMSLRMCIQVADCSAGQTRMWGGAIPTPMMQLGNSLPNPTWQGTRSGMAGGAFSLAVQVDRLIQAREAASLVAIASDFALLPLSHGTVTSLCIDARTLDQFFNLTPCAIPTNLCVLCVLPAMEEAMIPHTRHNRCRRRLNLGGRLERDGRW